MMSLLLTVLFVLFMFLRVPVSMAIALATLPPLLILDRNLVLIPQFMLDGVASAALLAVPFFILAGHLFNSLGLSRRIWDFALTLVGHLKGGLGHVMVISNMIFAGISGSALADAAGLGVIGIPAMERNRHSRAYATALTLCSSVIGPMIPPSINLVIYGIVAQESIGRLFLAGVVPGIVIGLAMMAMVWWLAFTGREVGLVQPRRSVGEMGRSAVVNFPALVVPLIVLAGMGFGVITPTEVGVACVVYAIVVGWFYRDTSWRRIYDSLVESTRSTVTIMFIVAVSTVAGWIYTYDGVAQAIADGMLGLTENRIVILLLINLFLLALGCILEPIPVLVLATPIFMPVITKLGIDPVHFGIVVNLNITIGIITPPMGIGLYVMMGIVDIRFGDLVKACLPFFIPLIGCLMLFTYVPALSLWLPNLLMGAR
ncbi:MAG: TRAP transporter large permease [Alphaproteobacteria bacterium]|nr:TRAP transporter large permease [Alphaproteobacteria bacterium]